jgi:holo-[acyl-carrier protein] synthase
LIVGLGLDIAEIDRIEAAITRHGAPILERLYTPTEVAYCESHRNKFERYAGRFAAKEAAMKALGTGWRRGVRWRDIEVIRERSGKPSRRAWHEKHFPHHYTQRKPRTGRSYFRKLAS